MALELEAFGEVVHVTTATRRVLGLGSGGSSGGLLWWHLIVVIVVAAGVVVVLVVVSGGSGSWGGADDARVGWRRVSVTTTTTGK